MNPRNTPSLFIARFVPKTLFTNEHWLWKGALNSDGYPNLWWDDTVQSAHVLAYTFWVGDVPERFEVHHTCHKRNCVYPEHLYATDRDTHTAMHVKDRHSLPHYCKQGHLIAPGNQYKNGKYFRCKTCTDRRLR